MRIVGRPDPWGIRPFAYLAQKRRTDPLYTLARYSHGTFRSTSLCLVGRIRVQSRDDVRVCATASKTTTGAKNATRNATRNATSTQSLHAGGAGEKQPGSRDHKR